MEIHYAFKDEIFSPRMVRRRATKEVAKRSAREKRGFRLGWDCVAFISAWFAHTSAMENYAVKTELLR